MSHLEYDGLWEDEGLDVLELLQPRQDLFHRLAQRLLRHRAHAHNDLRREQPQGQLGFPTDDLSLFQTKFFLPKSNANSPYMVVAQTALPPDIELGQNTPAMRGPSCT